MYKKQTGLDLRFNRHSNDYNGTGIYSFSFLMAKMRFIVLRQHVKHCGYEFE